MSTFNGTIKEIPSISVDRFDKHNLRNSFFFLSHCHMDHMVGLENLGDLTAPLYLSEISEVFVRHQYPKIRWIISLEIGVPTKININDENIPFVNVTAIPAGHCPGSIMFLFQANDTQILYTGDFRIPVKQLAEIEYLKLFNKGSAVLHTIYLDSTFFSEDYYEFPTQFESIDAIRKLIQEWIAKGPKYLIHLRLSARYGAEYLYIELARILKLQIHVNAEEFQKYKYISAMDGCITDNPKLTQVHACYKSTICPELGNCKYVRVIKPSAMIWKQWGSHDKNRDIVKYENNMYRVCYSNHSSYKEIEDFLTYLKPRKVYFNVRPENMEAMEKMEKLLDAIVKPLHVEQESPNRSITFSKIKTHSNVPKLNVGGDSSEDEMILPVVLPKRKKLNY